MRSSAFSSLIMDSDEFGSTPWSFDSCFSLSPRCTSLMEAKDNEPALEDAEPKEKTEFEEANILPILFAVVDDVQVKDSLASSNMSRFGFALPERPC